MVRTKATIKVEDLMSGATTEADEKAADAFADAMADMGPEATEDDDEGLTQEQLREIGDQRLAELIDASNLPHDNSGPKMTPKQKERVINRDTSVDGSAGTPAADDPSEAHAPKAPKLCLFSGLPTGGGKFRPGYDAKLKSALIRRFRGESVETTGMSEVLATRFTDGDLVTSEGALDYMIQLDWGHFATTKAQKQKVAADARTPVEVLQQTIESALRKYGGFTAEIEDVLGSVMDTIDSFLPTEEAASEEGTEAA